MIGVLMAFALAADVTAARPIARGEIISASDLSGAQAEVALIAGKAARRPLFEGRRVRPVDVQTPRAVMRQQQIIVRFVRGALTLKTEGRALADGRVGERISVALEGRRSPVSGVITDTGVVEVGL